MPDFGRIINLAYMRILGRPADPGGQESYDSLMNQGMTEAMMREGLLRSPEYAANNPDQASQAARATKASATRQSKAAKASKAAKKKTKAKQRTKKAKSRRKTS
jgi:hypothetical protein